MPTKATTTRRALRCAALAGLLASLFLGGSHGAAASDPAETSITAASATTADRFQPLWQIGAVDRSSGEFRDVFEDYARSDFEPVFHVGRSAATAWPAFHPGPAAGLAGGREHPYTIEFDLPHDPRGVYRLDLSILHQTPRLSHLRIELNGHSGRFYFRPVLDHAGGDQLGITVPHTSHADRAIELPADYLVRGENRLVLTALDEPAEREPVWSWTPGHTGFFYDAIGLSVDRNAVYDPNAITARLASTIFYRRGGADEGGDRGGRGANKSAGERRGPTQLLQADVAFARMPREWTLVTRVGEVRRETRVTSTDAFGEHRVEIEVPAWTGSANASIEVRSGSDTLTSESLELAPGRKWTLYVVPLVHLDIGFTHWPGVVEELQSEALDRALRMIRDDPDYRYVIDGFWVVERYLAGRTEKARDALLDAARAGRIAIPPQIANQHTGTASLEGQIRSLYGGHFFAKRNGLPLEPPHIVDVPTYPGSYASVLHAAGYSEFLAAANGWRAPILLQGRWNERSPFYWEGPDGGRVLMWYSRGYNQLQMLLGTPAKPTAARSALPIFLQGYERPDYAADRVIVFGTQSENARLDPAQLDFVKRWGKGWAWPKLAFATFGEAIQGIEEDWRGGFEGLEVARGDFGPYWVDGAGSDARHTALHRENQHRITSAETLSTLNSLYGRGVAPDTARLERAWDDLLLCDEHTFSSMVATSEPDHAQSTGQAEIKRSRAIAARHAIDASLARSLAQLATNIGPSRWTIAVWNAQNVPRNGLVELDLPIGSEPFDLASARHVPVETVAVRPSRLPALGAGHARIRFLAEDVPALGYKLFSLQPGDEGQERTAVALSVDQRVFESPHYRVTLDPARGGIASILDRELGTELVDTGSPYRLGSVLYVTGGDDPPHNTLFRNSDALPIPELTVHAAREGRLVAATRVPFGIELELHSTAERLPRIRTLVRLHDREKKIEIEIELEKEAVRSREAAYVAFPLANPEKRFGYSTQNGWVDPARDTLAGGSREWFPVTGWAAVRGPGVTTSVTPVDAPLVTFGDIARGRWPEHFRPASGSVFSWLMNNYWPMNFPAEQGGAFRFRYVLRSRARFDVGALTRDALADLEPLEVALLAPRERRRSPLPETAASLLDLGTADLALLTWKPAEDRNGTILRLVEIGGSAGETTIRSDSLTFTGAFRATALEENTQRLRLEKGGVKLSFDPFEIVTLRLLR